MKASLPPVTLPTTQSTRVRTARRLTAMTVATVLVANLLQVPALAAPPADPDRPARQEVPTVPVTRVKAEERPARKPVKDARTKPAPVWPAAGSAVVEVPDAESRTAATAADLPVRIAAPEPFDTASGAAAPLDRVRVEVLDRAATERAGVRGVLLRLIRADGVTTSGSVRVSVDYGSFATGYGADWASRLRLVALPECALTTPEQRHCVGTPLRSTNDRKAATVSAEVPVGAGNGVVAVSAGPSGPAGDYTATSLQPSSTWVAGGSSGDFSWSYPMGTPPGVGGPVPDVALSYSAQSVDGRHAASNNQPSWVGEGFEGWPGGYIERRYRPCAKDMDGSANNDEKTGDLCWETDNAILSLSGSSGELIYNDSEGRWHARSDDGTRIERKTGASNGDQGEEPDGSDPGDVGEHWVVTTTDGMQYWFGLNRLPGWTADDPVTNSTWTAPVFGNDPDEPCHASTFEGSDCVQAWRWNLDYVVDLRGNSLSYWYKKETNKYARNLDPADDASYDRGGWLNHIDYGTRRDNGVDSVLNDLAPARVDFAEVDRCLSGCATHDEAHWPDTPWDSQCTATSCPDNFSPTFWSTKRLGSITTQIRSGSGYANVARWTLTHSFPDPGDGTRAGLWLDRISYAGLVGTTTSLPDVIFEPVQLSNRVDTIDFAEAMNWHRIASIQNESGGVISITYSQPDCVAGQTPTPHTNNRRCYPVVWTPEGYEDPVTDWFHKYVVEAVREEDMTGGVPPLGSPDVLYTYRYLDGPSWHYNDDDGLIQKEEKTWSDYRGYGKVAVTVGERAEDQTYAETRYFKGMNGDRSTPTGGTRSVNVDGIPDHDWYAGIVREEKVLNGPGGAVVSREVNDPWGSSATASRTINGDTVTARFTRIATSRTYTTLDGGRGERVTRTTSSFDEYGMTIQVDDYGEEGVSGDEKCTKHDYTPRNDAIWLMDLVHRTQNYAVACAASAGTLTDADVIGESRLWYDDHAFEAAATTGVTTRSEEMSAWNNGTPAFVTTSRTSYDIHGRATQFWDAAGAQTTTTYTPVTGGPVTGNAVTNHLLHQTVTTVNPAWGSATAIVDPNGKQTNLQYDGLGRLTSVWLPGRETTQPANAVFGYLIRNNASTVVSTARLNAAGEYVTTYSHFDGLLRARQTQAASPNGGRLLTDTFYDTAGRKVRAHDAYYTSGTPGNDLVTAADQSDVPRQRRIVYDGAGRVVEEIFRSYAVERWRTQIRYGGDRTDVTPPDGGTATSTVTDARGRTVALRQYHGAAPSPDTPGSWDATSYAFNRKGQLVTVTDPAGNDWAYTYDIRGRQTGVDDPDNGITTYTYDNAGRVTSTIDGRGKKLAYLYDRLGRKLATYENQPGGPQLAEWQYDTLAKGYLNKSSRKSNGSEYSFQIEEYSDTYQPKKVAIAIPAAETGLGGIYRFESTWNVDGSLASTSFPAISGDLPGETLDYSYNSVGLPTTLNSIYGGTNVQYVTNVAYTALGQVETLDLFTGTSMAGRVRRSFEWDLTTGRLSAAKTDRDRVDPKVLADYRYTYDDAGNMIRIADVSPDLIDDTQCFEHDHLRRLTEAWTPESGDCTVAPSATELGGPAPYWRSWTFDEVGNRLSEVVHTESGNLTTDYTYPDPGSPQPHTLQAVSGAQAGAYTYNAAGQTLTRPTESAGTQTLTWDPEGHLATSSDASGTTKYLYDADGNRLISRDPGGAATLYLPGQELRYTPGVGTTATRYYSHGSAVVGSRTAAGLTWLSGDHQGTAQVSVNAANQQATIRRQFPYGLPRGGDPAWANDKGFVGGTRDNTGLTHLGAREYDPQIGRFISVDPIMDLADPQQMNGYAYANNSPISFSDPDGLKPLFSNTPQEDEELEKETGQEFKKGKDGKWWPTEGGGGGGKSPRPKPQGPFLNNLMIPEGGPELLELARAVGKHADEYISPEFGDYSVDALETAQIIYDLCLDKEIKCSDHFKRQIWQMWWLAVRPDWIITLVTEGLGSVGPKGVRRNQNAMSPAQRFGRKLGPCGWMSFSGDTRVLMADGTAKAIEDIKVGDLVLATDPETGERGPRKVTHVWVHQDELVDLQLADPRAAITTTEDHPFWNHTDQQWQEAAQPDRGDLLLTPSGNVSVEGLTSDTVEGAAYNLTVDDIHTYYVLAGDTPVLVHNCETGGFKVGIGADEVTEINRGFGGQTTLNGSFENTMANASRYGSFWDKSAVAIRDIAGGHMFDNGNKRTAQAVVEQLMQRNNIISGPTSAELRNVIDAVGKGQLTSVEDISRALRGF